MDIKEEKKWQIDGQQMPFCFFQTPYYSSDLFQLKQEPKFSPIWKHLLVNIVFGVF